MSFCRCGQYRKRRRASAIEVWSNKNVIFQSVRIRMCYFNKSHWRTTVFVTFRVFKWCRIF